MKILLFKGLLWVTSVLPLPVSHAFGSIVGYFLYIIPNKVRYVSKCNINLCFSDQTDHYRNQLLKHSLIELGKWLFELGPVWSWSMQKLNKTITSREGESEVLACLASGQGVLIATPHLGNWELAGLAGSEIFPLTILYKPPKIPGIEENVRNARARGGAEVVSINQGGLKRIISTLKAGKAVGLLPDQEPKDMASGVFAPFFNVNALTMTLFQKLARKTGAAVFFATMIRLPRGRGYQFQLRRADDALGSEDEIIAASMLNKELEETIKSCPEQYLWAYRRFKQRSEGEPPVY